MIRSKSSSNRTPGDDRYKYDLEQAEMMTRRKGKKESDTPDTETTGPSGPKQHEILLAMNGLEEAQKLLKKGGIKDREEALTLYELSIELMLKCMRQETDPGTKELMTHQTTVALSEAENLKLSLSRNQQTTHQPSQEPRKSAAVSAQKKESSIFGSLSNSLITAIQGKFDSSRAQMTTTTKTAAATANDRVNTAKPKKKRSVRKTPSTPVATTAAAGYASVKPITETTKKRSVKKSPPASSSSVSTTNSSNKDNSTKTTGQPSRARRRILNDQDPLVQQVKSDLYIDPSELQKVTWDDIAGLQRAKQSLQESAILPLLRPDLFKGLRKASNILLYGPPGTGKTLLVKAVANESSCLLFACSASTLTSKWHGEGEKLVRCLFRLAQDVAPSLIFIDEMDALLSNRSENEHEASRRFKTEFMVQMDGIGGDENAGSVLVVGATNCPWSIDDAVLRRFPRRIPIPLPDSDARKALIKGLLKRAGKHSLSPRQQSVLVGKLDGYSCSDISSIASEASFGPLREMGMARIQTVQESQLRPISLEDFEKSIQLTTKSVSQNLLKKYEEWEREQGAG